ncbi:MIP/aquaporin family protein [Paractinoplanes brasiliensis]|uniref:Glycerol uptake facilitator protein n=1 Tax=Paractinoplanes brasiliensis TaxID=52695 RepID=A0A4R6JPD4_9ACTN|nr:aquaporin [Actinoplanes brasiliensis]TDO36646.1 glycerol uptake facilitator protein [Actinoplanes brasiliensis]GID33405.1 hypothetical protein Abr02nite_83880 [Actinoplanes brasiliensis]
MGILQVTMRDIAVEARAAAVEFCLTSTFMATVFTLVRWGVGTMPATASANELRLRVAAVSILVGLVIVGFAVSPPGRFSGAHMNPAITLGLYASGSFPGRRVVPYLGAQIAGSVTAAALAGALWGSSPAAKPVQWAVVQPGPGWTGASVTVAEAMTLMVIVGVMCWMTARRPNWPAAWIVGGLFGLQAALLGTLTGGSANPARQLGPALFSGESHLLAVYLLAPVAGGMLAGRIARRLLTPRIRDFGSVALRNGSWWGHVIKENLGDRASARAGR